MKYISVTMAIILMSFSTLSAEKMDLITGKINLVDGGDAKKEVYVYYNRFRSSKDNLLKVVEVDPSGEFEIELSESINYAELHLAAEGYEAYITKYIEGDDNPRVVADLHKRKIPADFDSVSALVYLKNGRLWNKEPIGKDGKVQLEFDLKSDDYSKYYKGDGTVSYTVLFGNGSVSPEEHDGEWEYDHNGDYNAVVEVVNDKIILNVDSKDYTTTEDETELSMTSGRWVNSPVNEAYNNYIEQVPAVDVDKLRQEYYYFVHQRNKNLLKKYTDEKINERKQNALKKFNNYLTISDNTLNSIDSPYLNDFIKLTKHKLLMAADSLDTWEHHKKLLRSLQEIPTVFYSNFNDIIYRDEFKENPKPYIEALENAYLKSLNKRNRCYLRYGLYSRLSDSEFADNPEYVEALRAELTEIGKYDDLDSWPRDGVPKDLAKLKLKSLTHAPDFTFKTTEGKEKKLSDFRGKWVLLDFWGTWCGPCRGETPHLVKAYNELKDDDFEIISVSSDRSAKVVIDYMEKNKMEWPNTIDLDGYAKGVLKQYGINSFPTVMLIDPEGKLVKIKSHELRGKGLITTLKEQMDG
jgi:thiol-disulfide isomerase/thioredoxin